MAFAGDAVTQLTYRRLSRLARLSIVGRKRKLTDVDPARGVMEDPFYRSTSPGVTKGNNNA